MKSITWLSHIFWILLDLVLVLLASCTQRLWPSGQGIPERAIVFEIRASLAPDSALGFVNPDGTGLITRTQAPGSGVYTAMPTWSPDGQYIALMSSPSSTAGLFGSYSAAIVSHGGEWLRDCPSWEWNNGRVRITADDQLLLPLQLAHERRERIVLADMRTCEVSSTLYRAPGPVNEIRLGSADLSLDGWLAVDQSAPWGCPREWEIVAVDPVSGSDQVVAKGIAPAWSPDGEWLAYTAFDGIYLVRRDGTEPRRIVDIDLRDEACISNGWERSPPAPSWSPDGRWLAYHRGHHGAAIYKVNIESREEFLVVYRGLYPDWRWDLDH